MGYPRAGADQLAEPAASDTASLRIEHLGALTDAALAHLDLDDLLEVMLGRIREILNVDTTAVLLLDEEGDELVARAARGLEEEVAEGVRIPIGTGFAGRIAADREPVFVHDVANAGIVNPILTERGVASLLGVPLLVEGRMLGVLHVGSLAPRHFTEADADLLQLAADRMALAIDHARLYESERRAREMAERRADELAALQTITDAALGRLSLDEDILVSMLERVRSVLRVDTAAVLLITPEGDELVARAARGLEEEVEQGVRIPFGGGFAGSIAAQKRPVIIEDLGPGDVLNPILIDKGIHTLLGVPLLVGERVLGVLHVGSLTPRKFTEADVALLERAADRVAITVDRAQQRTVAEVLQRSLLPPSLPEVPGLSMAARYLPGADDAHVGGDWYDVIPLGGNRVGIAMGDVVSRGVRAAAAMGQMRTALRAYALDGESPGPVLDRLDRLVRGMHDREMATVAYLVLDPAAARVAYALAGHPPPLVISSSGETRFLEGARSRPVGVAASRLYEEATDELRPGDTLVVYTDGLVERRGESLTDGLEALAQAAVRALDHPETMCDRLCADVGPPIDDVAVLVLRVAAAGPDRLELRLRAEPGSLATLRRALREWLATTPASDEDGYDILVATGEAAANAVEHAYGPAEAEFEVRAELSGSDAIVTIRDRGRWRPARGTHRGRGLELIRRLMDEVDVDTTDEGTEVTMRLSLDKGTSG